MRLSSAIVIGIASTARAAAQVIEIASYQFDPDGCVAPTDVYNCYQKAGADRISFSNKCNNADLTPVNLRANCIIAASEAFEENTIGCMIAGCWNRIPSCEFQLAIAAYVHDAEDSNPPYFVTDYDNLPGSCVCNIPELYKVIYTSVTTQCVIAQSPDEATCECCARGERFAVLQQTCPHNSLDQLGYQFFAQEQAQETQQKCPGFGDSSWLSDLQNECPAQGFPSNTSYLNPLSLPAGFPATAPLSNIPGSITDTAQIADGSSFVWPWAPGFTGTYVLSPYNANAVATTAAQQTGGVISGSANTGTVGAVQTTNTAYTVKLLELAQRRRLSLGRVV